MSNVGEKDGNDVGVDNDYRIIIRKHTRPMSLFVCVDVYSSGRLR